MKIGRREAYVIGLDYGTDSCRALVVDAADGGEVGTAVAPYKRWAEGLYCDPAANRFRQHPSDYMEAMETAITGALKEAGAAAAERVRGIAIDTTGSTPCAVDERGVPLAFKDEFADNPAAMFVLWKDHTATAEAAQINETAKTWGGIDYTKFEGGVYSSEWFWAKIMRILKEDPKVAAAAVSFLEHCDWMPALLTGAKTLSSIKRSRCAMGHKAMWHNDFGGYPEDSFLARLDPRLPAIKESLGAKTFTADTVAGALTASWAERLGLPAGIPVAVGAYDAHMGAVGGGVRPGRLVKVMGTSTCDMIVGARNPNQTEEEPLKGICGQVDGSIIPGVIGYEAGQSAFGDVYAWFRKLLLWPVQQLLPTLEGVEEKTKNSIMKTLTARLIPELEKAAEKIEPESSALIAVDWLNGRRTPDADQTLSGAIAGLSLGSDAPRVYRALAEATAFGARAIVERFREEGVAIEGVIGIGGVARKAPFIMQLVADVLQTPIDVIASDQSVALGASMFAATAAALYPSVEAAQTAMAAPIEKRYIPNPERAAVYDRLYQRYRALGAFVEEGR